MLELVTKSYCPVGFGLIALTDISLYAISFIYFVRQFTFADVATRGSFCILGDSRKLGFACEIKEASTEGTFVNGWYMIEEEVL